MCLNLFNIKLCPFCMFTLITKDLLFPLFWADFFIPSIIALWEISSLFSSFCKHILSSPKHCKISLHHVICDKSWFYNTTTLIWIIIFYIINCLFKWIFRIEGYISLYQLLLQLFVLILKFTNYFS